VYIPPPPLPEEANLRQTSVALDAGHVRMQTGGISDTGWGIKGIGVYPQNFFGNKNSLILWNDSIEGEKC